MALDWKRVTAYHVTTACTQVAAQGTEVSRAGRGLVVRFGDQLLPAKQVLREAYRQAAGLPPDRESRFTSGDGTLKLLQSLGFDAFRLGPAA